MDTLGTRFTIKIIEIYFAQSMHHHDACLCLPDDVLIVVCYGTCTKCNKKKVFINRQKEKSERMIWYASTILATGKDPQWNKSSKMMVKGETLFISLGILGYVSQKKKLGNIYNSHNKGIFRRIPTCIDITNLYSPDVAFFSFFKFFCET